MQNQQSYCSIVHPFHHIDGTGTDVPAPVRIDRAGYHCAAAGTANASDREEVVRYRSSVFTVAAGNAGNCMRMDSMTASIL